MEDSIEHDFTLIVPEHQWDVTKKRLRKLREDHRDAGGTSRVVKKGEHVQVTVSGPVKAVLDTLDALKRMATKDVDSKSEYSRIPIVLADHVLKT